MIARRELKKLKSNKKLNSGNLNVPLMLEFKKIKKQGVLTT
jgi:hypothetical protein